TVTVPSVPSGQYYFFVKVVSANPNTRAFEEHEAKNRKMVPITVTAPDLPAAPVTALASATPGDVFSIAWPVVNQGTGPLPVSWTDDVYLSADAVCCTGSTHLASVSNAGGLNPGAGYSKTKSVTIPNVAAGTYYLILLADGGHDVYEGDETNNQFAIPIRITVPDLVPMALIAPPSAGPQQSISVSWTVANLGTSAAQPSWADRLYLSADQT